MTLAVAFALLGLWRAERTWPLILTSWFEVTQIASYAAGVLAFIIIALHQGSRSTVPTAKSGGCLMWHRIRLTGGALQAGVEEDRVLRKIHSWVTLNGAVELSKFGRPLTHEDAKIYSYWDGDDKVWHLNEAALKVYRAVGGTRDVEAAVASVPSVPGQALLLSTRIFTPT